MQRREFRIGLILLVSAGAALLLFQRTSSTGRPVVINDTAAPPVPTLDLDRVEYGESLYTQYCAGCHGANLEGAADWKQRLPDGSLPPPPHDSSGHTWHHPDCQLVRSILEGGADKTRPLAMPAFQDKLSYEQIDAVLSYIKLMWTPEQRSVQAQITREMCLP